MAFIYNGDEIGMKNGHVPPEMVQDPAAVGKAGRDPERTPLQWSPEKNAGFSVADTTWLPVADNYKTHNVETELVDPNSFLSLYRKLGKLRNQSDALKYGKFEIVDTGNPHVLSYTRTQGEEKYTIFINFSNEPHVFTLNSKTQLGELIASSDPQTKLQATGTKIHLQPHEAAIFAS